jgi:hypothetical protein
MKTLLITTAFVFAMTLGANAAQLGAGPIYSANAHYAYCWWINLGTATVTPTSQLMYSFNSNTAISTSSTCPNGSPVGLGTSCWIYPNSSGGITGLSCKVVFSMGVANIRGSLELVDPSNNEISQVELR